MIDNKTIRKVIMLNKMLPGGSPTYEDREASGAVANFTTNTVQPFVKCECEILPIQEGTGTPSPSNPRPISGTDKLTLTHTTYRTAETYTIDLGQEIIGGTADVVGGVGEETHGSFSSVDIVNVGFDSTNPDTTIGIIYRVVNNLPAWVSNTMISERFSRSIPSGTAGRMVVYENDIYFVVPTSELSEATASGLIEWLHNNPTLFVFELATPTSFTFTGQPINSYLGVNNVWTKVGDTKVTYKYKTGEGGSSTKKYLPIFYDIYGKEKYK